METALLDLQHGVRALLSAAGCAAAGAPPLTAYRFTSGKIQLPQSGNPYLYLVLDGTLRLHTPSGIMDYAPGQYSISQIDTPLMGTVLTFSDRGDFLALAVDFAANDVIASALEIDNDLMEKIVGGTLTEQEAASSDRALIAGVYRLFALKGQALPSEFMRKNIMREIIYVVSVFNEQAK